MNERTAPEELMNPRPKYEYSVGSIGKTPDHNEDASITLADFGVFGVLDGVGGSRHGEVGSEESIHFIAKKIQEMPTDLVGQELDNRLVNILEETNRYLVGFRDKGIEAMSTVTLVAFEERDDEPVVLHVANVGDCRLYHLPKKSRELSQITIDDNVVLDNMLDDTGRRSALKKLNNASQLKDITYDIANLYEQRANISQCLGYKQMKKPRVFTVNGIEPGDSFLLSTDGVHDNLTDNEIEEILANSATTTEAQEAIVKKAYNRGQKRDSFRAKRDDITALVIKISSGETGTEEIDDIPIISGQPIQVYKNPGENYGQD